MKITGLIFVFAIIMVFSTNIVMANPVFLQVEGRVGQFDDADLSNQSSDFPASGEINIKIGKTLNSGDSFGLGYQGLSSNVQIPGGDFFTASNVFAFYQIRTKMDGDSSVGFTIEVGVGEGTRDPSIGALPPDEEPLPTSDVSFYFSGTLFWEKPVAEDVSVVIGGGYRMARFNEVNADFTGFVGLLGIKIGG
jgi:hypothetical protein